MFLAVSPAPKSNPDNTERTMSHVRLIAKKYPNKMPNPLMNIMSMKIFRFPVSSVNFPQTKANGNPTHEERADNIPISDTSPPIVAEIINKGISVPAAAIAAEKGKNVLIQKSLFNCLTIK